MLNLTEEQEKILKKIPAEYFKRSNQHDKIVFRSPFIILTIQEGGSSTIRVYSNRKAYLPVKVRYRYGWRGVISLANLKINAHFVISLDGNKEELGDFYINFSVRWDNSFSPIIDISCIAKQQRRVLYTATSKDPEVYLMLVSANENKTFAPLWDYLLEKNIISIDSANALGMSKDRLNKAKMFLNLFKIFIYGTSYSDKRFRLLIENDSFLFSNKENKFSLKFKENSTEVESVSCPNIILTKDDFWLEFKGQKYKNLSHQEYYRKMRKDNYKSNNNINALREYFKV